MQKCLNTRLFLCVCVFACLISIIDRVGHSESENEPRIVWEEIPNVPKRYWFLYEDNWPFNEREEQIARDGLPFEEITLSRGGLFVPSYTITLKRDGSASYEGQENVQRRGKHRGAVSLDQFGRLCYLLERQKFQELPPDIRSDKSYGSHASGVTIEVRAAGQAKPVSIHEINGTGPIELWAIQTVIDGIAAGIDWQRIDEQPK